MQSIRGSKPSHSGAKDYNIWFYHQISPKFCYELKSPEKHSRSFEIDRGTFPIRSSVNSWKARERYHSAAQAGYKKNTGGLRQSGMPLLRCPALRGMARLFCTISNSTSGLGYGVFRGWMEPVFYEEYRQFRPNKRSDVIVPVRQAAAARMSLAPPRLQLATVHSVLAKASPLSLRKCQQCDRGRQHRPLRCHASGRILLKDL